MRMNRRRLISRLLGGILLVAIFFFVARPFYAGTIPFGANRAADGGEEESAQETATIFRGDLAATASASGVVRARREAQLAPAMAGTVARVYVEAGDAVRAGDPLVALEADALERAVSAAEQSVAIQQANLERMLEGARPAESAAAEAAVASARARLQSLLDGPTEQEIAVAEANLRAAQANVSGAARQLGQVENGGGGEVALLRAQDRLAAAEAALDAAEAAFTALCGEEAQSSAECAAGDVPAARVLELGVVAAREGLAAARAELEAVQNGVDADTVGAARAGVSQAAAQRDAAEANLDLLLAGATGAEFAAARATLADAEAGLARLNAGAGEAELAAARVGLAQAEIALERAQNNLERAVLRAPFAGTVTAVYVAEGETASGPVIALVDTTELEVVVNVDEVDIGALEVGQPAVVHLEAWPDRPLETEIVSIDPAAGSLRLDNSIATFRVILALPPGELPVRVGMTADTNLQTARREGVLLVPNRAITIDRQRGTYWVNLVEMGPEGEETVRPVEISIGLRDARFTEVTGGLEEGDRVRIGPVELPGQEEEEERRRRRDEGPFGAAPGGGWERA